MKKSIFGFALIFSILLIASVSAVGIRITGPSVVEQGKSYQLYVEAENTGLNGQGTAAVEWFRFNAPSSIILNSVSKPSASSDFFEGQQMAFEFLSLDRGVGRVIWGNGVVNKNWSIVAIYNFTVKNNLSVSTLMNNKFTMLEVTFLSKSIDEQLYTDYEFTFTIVPLKLDGDANNDCRVNILDLIYVRNRMNTPDLSGDMNKDGRINILDLIYVRNRLNSACA